MSVSQADPSGRVDVKEAVRKAKDWVKDMFADENPANIGLEEVSFDPEQSRWRVTVGFTRPWDQTSVWQNTALAAALQIPPRVYKVVILSPGGEVVGLANRDV